MLGDEAAGARTLCTDMMEVWLFYLLDRIWCEEGQEVAG